MVYSTLTARGSLIHYGTFVEDGSLVESGALRFAG
jgi:hypothetical protein